MGYHVHILRTLSGEKIPITVEEVSQTLAGNSGFRMNKDVDGNVIVEMPGEEEIPPCLWFSEGELWTKNPDEKTIDAMCELAKLLDGRVRGDELESYHSASEAYLHPDDEAERAEVARLGNEARDRTKRRSLVMNCCIFGTFAVLGLIAATCSR